MKYPRYINATMLSFSKMTAEDNEREFEEALLQEIDPSTMEVESRILSMLKILPSDRDRLILLFLILRSNGYRFPYKNIAKALGVDVVWIKKLKVRVVKKLKEAGEHRK